MTGFVLPDGITLANDPTPHVRVDVPQARGAVYLNGAHITDWAPAGAEPVVWTPDQRFEEGRPIRGGIPICFPWFGRGPNRDKEPRHGYARTQRWDLVAASASGGADLAFELARDEFTARLRVTMGDALSVTLEVTAGANGFDFEEALHTYYAVGDVRRTRVAGLDREEYIDAADGWATRTQTGDVTLTGETDRIYYSVGPIAIHDEANGRVLTLTRHHSGNAVVWNPWTDDTAGMVCVEAANCRENRVALAAGASHVMGMTIEVSAPTR